MNTITFRLSTQQKSQLISIAKERNVTVSALLRQILRPYADAQGQGNGVDKTSVSRLLLSHLFANLKGLLSSKHF